MDTVSRPSSRLLDGRWCATVVLSSQHQAGRRRTRCVHKRSQTRIGQGSTAASPIRQQHRAPGPGLRRSQTGFGPTATHALHMPRRASDWRISNSHNGREPVSHREGFSSTFLFSAPGAADGTPASHVRILIGFPNFSYRVGCRASVRRLPGRLQTDHQMCARAKRADCGLAFATRPSPQPNCE